MSYDRSKVQAINISPDGYNTYGYDDDPIRGYCSETKQNIQITPKYRSPFKSMCPLITLYFCNKSLRKQEKNNAGDMINICVNDNNCNNYCECHQCLAACGKIQKWNDYTGIDHQTESESISKPSKEVLNKLTEFIIWKDLFPTLDEYGYFTIIGDIRYLSAKEKILKGKFSEVTKEEYTQILGALKSTEGTLCKSQREKDKANAYLVRRVLFHGREIGCNGFAELKDKYGGCYIATTIYGSYNAPQVRILRCFRDNYLEKRKFGRLFVSVYYKYSPDLVKKLESKKIINGIIKFFLDNFIIIFAKKRKQNSL